MSDSYSGSDSPASSEPSSSSPSDSTSPSLDNPTPAPESASIPPADAFAELERSSPPDAESPGNPATGEPSLPSVAPIPGATDTGATIPTPLTDRPTSNTIGTGSTIALGCVAVAVIVVFVVILILTIVS
jgi:hypothetical protein